MPDNHFDWKTDDDTLAWEPSEPPEPPPKRQKRWWIGVITAVILTVCLASTLAYSRLNRRANAVSQQHREDVVAVHQLLLETAVSGDMDLFQSLLAQPGQPWAQTQIDLIEHDLFLNRAPLGVWFDYAQLPIVAEDVVAEFSPDLNRVTLSVKRPFLTQTKAEHYDPVFLYHTAVYVRQDNTWLLAGPDDDFWGSREVAESSILKIRYPARDARIVQQLLADLNNLVVDGCDADLFRCPGDLVVELHFSDKADSLASLNRNYSLASRYSNRNGRSYHLTFPTPTLVGDPVDDAGYEALYRGYAAQLLVTLMHNLNDPHEPDKTTNQLIAHLAQYDLWLPEPVGFHPENTAVSAPVLLPEQDVLLYCPFMPNELMRYDLAAAQWVPFIPGNQMPFIAGLAAMPDANGILVTQFTENGTRLHWLRAEADLTLLEADGSIFVSNIFVLPGTEAKPHYAINYFLRGPNTSHWVLLDEDSCTSEACEPAPLESYPIVSPNGRYRFVYPVNGATEMTKLEDAGSQMLASYDAIFSPLWLDETRFAFVQTEPFFLPDLPTQTNLVWGEVGPDGVQTYDITADELANFILQDGQTPNLFIGGLAPGPEQTLFAYLFIRDADAQPRLGYIIQFDPENGETALLDDLSGFETAVYLGSSANMRHAMVGLFDKIQVSMRLYDFHQQKTRTFDALSAWRGVFDWTPDSRWLLMVEQNSVRLVATEHQYDFQLFHDFEACETAVWVNPP